MSQYLSVLQFFWIKSCVLKQASSQNIHLSQYPFITVTGYTTENVPSCKLLQCREILDAMDKDSGLRLERVLVDGAMTGNALMMQTLADFLSELIHQQVTSSSCIILPAKVVSHPPFIYSLLTNLPETSS